MLLGIDLGTGSVKALLLDADGSPRRTSSARCAVRSPRRGWAESDPQEWWSATARAVREVVGGDAAEVEAIGLSGQMHGVVVCEDDGRPLRPAVLWADTRAGGMLQEYRDLDGETSRRLANPPAVGMAGPTLLWLRDEEPEAYRRARWALQPKDWLRLGLTNEAATEPSDASATLLYDFEADGWHDDLIDAIGLDGGMLPPVMRSTDVAGGLSKGAASDLGLRAGTPVAVGAADTAAAVIGTGLEEPGTFQLTVGTGAQVVSLLDAFSPDETGRTHLFRTAEPTEAPYYAMAAMQNAGLALEWVRRIFTGITWEVFYEEAFADGITPGAGGVTFVPHLGGERTPGFDPDSRGAWSGFGLEHGRGHLLRAAMEGVAFSIREGLEALDGVDTTDALHLAGGGSSDERWRGMLAGVLGRRLVSLPESVAVNASAVGAAVTAGMACKTIVKPPSSPEPQEATEPDDGSFYEEAYAAYLAARPPRER